MPYQKAWSVQATSQHRGTKTKQSDYEKIFNFKEGNGIESEKYANKLEIRKYGNKLKVELNGYYE